MADSVPIPSQESPSTKWVRHAGRDYALVWEREGWRLRSRAKSHPADFRTGSKVLKTAQQRAKEWLEKREDDPRISRKGGGTLEALVAEYMRTPKKTTQEAAGINVSRLRTVCRVALGRELAEVTCKEVGPALWETYQKAALAKLGKPFDLVTRHRENVAINSATRCARSIFLPALLRAYRATGLELNSDCADAVTLPVPYIKPSDVDDRGLVRAWIRLRKTDPRLWLVIGIARFAGLRREEIASMRAGWISVKKQSVSIELRDRPEEGFWSKTGKPYSVEVIGRRLRAYLAAVSQGDPLAYVVPNPIEDRARWFERVPQAWLRRQKVCAKKPLHRLRGLYADHIAELTRDAVAAKLAGVKAAQKNLGHTSEKTTLDHYLT